MRHLTRIFKTLIAILGVWMAIQLLVRLLRRFLPFPVPPFMSPFLESPLRELSQRPGETLQRIGLQAGQRALELEAGPGYFTLEAARLLGAEGVLSAVDMQPRMVALVAEKAAREGLSNVETRVAGARALPYPDGTFDLAFLVTGLGEIPDKGRLLREVRRVLKPNGRLSITEAMADPDYMLMAEVVGWAQTVGFELVEQHGNAFLYTLNFRSMFGP